MVTLELLDRHQNPKQLSPLTLAFLGDAAFELMVRERLVSKGSMPVGKLHKQTVKYVCASAQYEASVALAKVLTEEEYDIFKRGRNATGNHVPRNASPREYRAATGVEALFGFLYLQGDILRMTELFNYIMDHLDKEK